MNDDASSHQSADDQETAGITLQICKGHENRVFTDRESLEGHLTKKL